MSQVVDDVEAAVGEPLFTQERLNAWLAEQGLPIATTKIYRIVVDVDPVGWVRGPFVDIEFYLLDEKGERYLLPVSEEDAATNTRRPAVAAKRILMHRDWKS